MKEFILIILAYLIGSTPTALIVSKSFFNIDIRDYGSGNMGATNTFRVLGPKFGTVVMIGDMLKGILAVALYNLLPYYLTNELDRTHLLLGLGLAAVIGHIYPIWADVRGGKGVSTLFGMVLAIQPIIAINCVGVFLIVLYLTRYVSLSSILAGVALPICVLWIYNEQEVFYRVFAVAVAALIVLTHQKNISRLIKRNEGRVPILKHRDRRKSHRKEI
jgi:glycerol-3-phosphate acyltransferase PlsY